MVLELNPWGLAPGGSKQQHAAKSGENGLCRGKQAIKRNTPPSGWRCGGHRLFGDVKPDGIDWPRCDVHHFSAPRPRMGGRSRSACLLTSSLKRIETGQEWIVPRARLPWP